MNKLLKNISRMVGYVAAVAMLLLPTVSCSEAYDDSFVREELEQIKKDLAELEESLNTEINALKELVSGKISITNIETKADGSIVVTLSNGKVFTVYPKGAVVPNNLITVLENGDGVLCWAKYNNDGEAEFILVDGGYVPVSTTTPEVRVSADGKTIEISFDGGTTWTTTGYNQSVADTLIGDVEVVYSDWQEAEDGEPMPICCVITLADGVEVKVGMNSRIVMEYDSVYVAAGATSKFEVMAVEATDAMVIAPEGWACDALYDSKTALFTLSITAPKSAAIKSGEAVGEGVAKLIVIFNNGMSSIASIKLSTTPVNYNYFLDQITLSVGAGVEELVCGLVESASYTAEAAATAANGYLADNTQKGAYLVKFDNELTANVDAASLCANLDAAKAYTFWYVIPTVDNDGKKSVAATDISAEDYSYSAPSFEVVSTSFFDAEIKFSFKGSKGFIAGFVPKASYNVNDCLNEFRDNKDDLNLKSVADYNGSFLGLFGGTGAELSHNTTYVAWILECGGCNDVSVQNLRKWEFTTKGFSEGGNIEVSVSDVAIDYSQITAKLSTADERVYMYYAFALSNKVANYDDEAKFDLLLNDGKKSRAAGAVTANYFNATPNTKLTLMAVAVDKDGKYGKIFSQEYTTKAIEYNNLTPALEVVGDPSITLAELKATCEGAEGFAYVYAESDGSKWKSMGGTLAKAGEYLVMNAQSSRVYRAEKDGVIKISGLTPDVKYVAVVAAVDADGLLSEPVSVEFKPTIDLGGVVPQGHKDWSVGKPEVEVEVLVDRGSGGYFSFAWYVTPVEGYTAYSISMMPDHLSEYVDAEGNPVNIETTNDLIAYIVAYGSVCEYSADGYSRIWYEYADEDNDGRIDDEMKECREDNLVGVYCEDKRGVKDSSAIYTTWVDPDGNFHEPFVIDATTKKEID